MPNQLITLRLDLTGGAVHKSSFHFSPILLDNEKRIYRTRAIISGSQFEAALVYKPRILSLKN